MKKKKKKKKKKKRGCGLLHIEDRSPVGETRFFLGEHAKPVRDHRDALRFSTFKAAEEYIKKNEVSALWEIVSCGSMVDR